jgi:hypothetical protein
MKEKKEIGISGSETLFPVTEIMDMVFPNCSRHCCLFEIMGGSECESACPHKFKPVDSVRHNRS